MNKIYKNAIECIGNTPLIELGNFKRINNLEADILAKVEFFNVAGSVKDRAALQIIETAERENKIKKGGTIIEATSGNTGIGLAMIAAIKGYKVILTMPETMSIERRKLLKAYGAEIVLTDGSKGMSGAIEKANEILSQTENSFLAKQFENPANANAHRKTTGPEIWQATNGKIDIFVSAVGTGGTITGVGEYLKQQNPLIKVVAVEPNGSPFLSKGEKGPHKIQGIGAGFIPKLLNTKIYDQIITAEYDDCTASARLLAASEGLLCGISSGAALFAAKTLAQNPQNKNKKIIVILPDTGERYLSTDLYE